MLSSGMLNLLLGLLARTPEPTIGSGNFANSTQSAQTGGPAGDMAALRPGALLDFWGL